MGKEFTHDWKECNDRLLAEKAAKEKAGARDQETQGVNSNLPTRSACMLSTVRLVPIRLEAEKKKVRDLRLTMDLKVEFAPNALRKIRVLIDTGAEINLIRRGIAYPEYLMPVGRPIRIATANQAPMIGGEKEVHCVITLVAMKVDTGEDRFLEVPREFYEA